ncbi:RacP protein [Streptomyces sp. NPDC041068]|uniref:RacP protein n=1 Tax=Streptomyces sp. NPDC041068 TaxID=3155130 RepID=UPI0033D734ED
MGRGVPAHVHAEAVLDALREARPAGLTVHLLMAATERTRSQVYVGIREIRRVAAARGLPPLVWDRPHGYRLVDNAPEIWIGYEMAFTRRWERALGDFIAGILIPHQQQCPNDAVVRTLIAQFTAVLSTLELMAGLHQQP